MSAASPGPMVVANADRGLARSHLPKEQIDPLTLADDCSKDAFVKADGKCLLAEFRVIYARRIPNGIRRLKECCYCGKRRTTLERGWSIPIFAVKEQCIRLWRQLGTIRVLVVCCFQG